MLLKLFCEILIKKNPLDAAADIVLFGCDQSASQGSWLGNRLNIIEYSIIIVIATLTVSYSNSSLFETSHTCTKILPKSPNVQKIKFFILQTAVTFWLLNRFQSSWYLGCLARAETPENGIYKPDILRPIPSPGNKLELVK